MVNATWIAARENPYLSVIGLTNSVQPYCRLAIITMQMIPMNNCIHRYAGGRSTSGVGAFVSAMSPPGRFYYVDRRAVPATSIRCGTGLRRRLVAARWNPTPKRARAGAPEPPVAQVV